jgi:hypothetical protein
MTYIIRKRPNVINQYKVYSNGKSHSNEWLTYRNAKLQYFLLNGINIKTLEKDIFI